MFKMATSSGCCVKLMDKFFSSPRTVCISLSFMTALSWSFFDTLMGINRGIIGITVINTCMGISLILMAVISNIFGDRFELKTMTTIKIIVLLLGSLFFAIDSCTYTFADKLIPVGDVTLLFQMSILYTTILEHIYRKEFPSKSFVLSCFLSLVGVILVTQPKFIFSPSKSLSISMSSSVKGYILGFASGLAFAFGNVMCGNVGEIHWSLWSSFEGLVVIIGSLVLTRVDPSMNYSEISQLDGLAWLSLVLICLFDSAGRVCIFIACQVHSSSLMALIMVSQIAFTYVFSWIWVGEAMNGLKIGGVVIIIIAIVIVIVPSMLSKPKEEEKSLINDEQTELNEMEQSR